MAEVKSSLKRWDLKVSKAHSLKTAEEAQLQRKCVKCAKLVLWTCISKDHRDLFGFVLGILLWRLTKKRGQLPPNCSSGQPAACSWPGKCWAGQKAGASLFYFFHPRNPQILNWQLPAEWAVTLPPPPWWVKKVSVSGQFPALYKQNWAWQRSRFAWV